METRHVIENVATMTLTVLLILGLYHMGAGGWSACGAFLLVNMNFPAKKAGES